MIPNVAVGDSNVVNKLARMAGEDVVKEGGHAGLAKTYGTSGFELTIDGRKITAVPCRQRWSKSMLDWFVAPLRCPACGADSPNAGSRRTSVARRPMGLAYQSASSSMWWI